MNLNKKNVCILGAAGGQGQAILNAAEAAGYSCTVLRRSSSKSHSSSASLPRIVFGELEDCHAVSKAIDGASAVVFTIPLTFDSNQMKTIAEVIFDAVSKHRVPRLVFNASTITPEQDTDSEVINAYRQFTKMAEQVDSKVTVIRPTLFLENLLAPWTFPEIAGRGVIPIALPSEQSVAWLSHRELGRMVVASIETEELVGQRIDVGGATSVAGDELARRLGNAMNLPLRFESISPAILSGRVAPILGHEAAAEIGLHYEHFADKSNPICSFDTVFNRERLAHFELDSIELWAKEVLAKSLLHERQTVTSQEDYLTSRVDINIIDA